MAGSVKLGQPVPESNFASALNSSLPHAAQRYRPSSFEWTYLPVNGGSVPWRRNTSYSSGVSCSRHSSSVFSTFASIASSFRAQPTRDRGRAVNDSPTMPPLRLLKKLHTSRRRLAAVLVLALAIVAGQVALSGGDDGDATAPARI